MTVCQKAKILKRTLPLSGKSDITNMADGDGSSRNFRSAYYEKLGFCGNEEKNILDLLISSSSFDLEKLGDLCERFDLDRRCVDAWKVLLGVDCGRKNPFDEFANVRHVRAEHFQSLKHHLEVLLRHNIVMKSRLNKCSKVDSKSDANSKFPEEDGDVHLSQNNDPSGIFKDGKNVNSEGPTPTSNNEVMNDTLNNHTSEPNENSSQDGISEAIEANPGKMIALMYLLEAGRLESSDIDTQMNSNYCRKLSAMASFFVNVSSDLQEAFFLFRNFTRKSEENETLDT